jgi:type I restriction enzyme M protein
MAEKLICLIRQKPVTATKEEKIRQSYLGNLLYSLNYPKGHIKVEVPIQSGSGEILDVETQKPKRADIVVYDESTFENIKVIVEVKKQAEKLGEEQVKSYGNATNARYLVWHNGDETRVWRRVSYKGTGYKWESVPAVPIFGFEQGDVLPTRKQLHDITNARGLFQSINDFIWNNGNIKNRKDTFQQFVYVLLIKLYDEIFNEDPKFYILSSEYEEIYKTGRCKSFEARFGKAFQELKNSPDYKNIFDESDVLRLEPPVFAEMTYRLQWLKVRSCDSNGEAFQTFLSPYYRGENDQYLTPESVIQMILRIIKPTIKSRVLDLACGTGRFLTHTIVYCQDAIQKQDLKVKEWAQSHVFGIETDLQLVKISKAYMVLIGDGHANIIKEDSLSKDVHDYAVGNSSFSIVVTNPPFGRKGRRIGKLLEYYDLGHIWDESLQKTDNIRQIGQNQGILMLERSYQFLNDGGLIGIVLPDGVFSNLDDKYIRKWIATHFRILAVVSLPEETFRVESIGVNVKTSVLIAQKQSGLIEHEIFFAFPKTIGYNLQGEYLPSNEVLEVPKYYASKDEVEGKYFRITLTNEQIIDRVDVPYYSYRRNLEDTVPLKSICEDIFTGKTPTGKIAYLDNGKIKILKVRCLTNKMIDWSDKKRERYHQKVWK